jgi:hypothetical protein
MPIRKDKSLSQTYKIARANEVLALSEEKLIKVLKGEVKLPERVIVQVALELYKRRIPQHVEGGGPANSLTIIKIVKNHLPNNSGETIDIGSIGSTEVLDKVVDEKIRAINAKIKEKTDAQYTQDRKVNAT